MTDATTDLDASAQSRKKRGLMVPLLIGAVLAVLGGGGTFWAVSQGLILAPPESAVDAAPDPTPAARENIAFVPLETVIISLGPEEAGRHLIFTAELEVDSDYQAEVTRMAPRVLDVLNGYLRVVRIDELTEPTSLSRLRAQMLRRVQVVTGPHRVHDLLVTQFVVN